MIHRTLQQIQEMVGGTGLERKFYHTEVRGVSTDTRTLKGKNLYIPIKGERFNGHDFLGNALEHGAVAALWNTHEPKPELDIPVIYVQDTVLALQQLARAYRQQLRAKVIGITGSNGKTSTKDILAAILSTTFKTQKTSGNLNNHLGVPLTILQLEEQTEMAVIEMGMSGAGEIELLSNIAAPDAAVITNIGEAHLDCLESRDNILKAKLEILSGLKPDGLLVYNGDDPYLQKGIARHAAFPVPFQAKTFGMKGTNLLHPTAFVTEDKGVSFTVNDRACPKLFLPMLGKHQMINTMGAMLIARHFNVLYENIQQGLQRIEETGMRNEMIHLNEFTILNDAYKSNPSSLNASLEILYGLRGYSSKIVVLGDMNGMGTEEIKMHEDVGKQISTVHVDYLFTIGALMKHTAKTAEGRFPLGRVISCSDHNELVSKLTKVLVKNSILLIKGSRANELEKVVKKLQEATLHSVG